MIDLYMILIPAMLLILAAGHWIIRGMSRRPRTLGKLATLIIALSVGGIISVAFAMGVTSVIAIAAISGYMLWRRRPKK